MRSTEVMLSTQDDTTDRDGQRRTGSPSSKSNTQGNESGDDMVSGPEGDPISPPAGTVAEGEPASVSGTYTCYHCQAPISMQEQQILPSCPACSASPTYYWPPT